MKKIKRVLILLLALMGVLMGGCKDSGSPEAITELFLLSLNKLDYTTMRSISTKNTREMIKIMESITQQYPIDAAVLERRADTFKVRILGKTLINDSTARVKFETKPELLPINELQLVRVKEKLDKMVWKVDISTVELAKIKAEQLREEQTEPRTSYDGQLHPDADSVAAPE